MANRVLRDTTDSENVNSLSYQAEVFFYRLMMKADDFGSFHGNIKLVKAALFPLRLESVRDADVIRWITECEKSDLIVIYGAENKSYLRIVNFGQRLRKMKSKFPEPEIQQVNKSADNCQRSAADCGEPPPETETETKQKLETETEITTVKNFFRIRDVIVPETVSNYFKNNHRIFYEQWCMKNKEKLEIQVFEKMDTKYFGYTFTNENHVINSFTSMWEKIKSEKAKEPIEQFTKKRAQF